jgi:hypothetical protein
MRLRFSIRAVMGLVLIVAVGVAALRYPTDLVASLVLSATVLLVGVAILGAIFRRGAPRAFYAGAALFGLGYLVLAFGPWCETAVRPKLVTTRLLDAAFPRVHTAKKEAAEILQTGALYFRDYPGAPVQELAFSSDGNLLTAKVQERAWVYLKRATGQANRAGGALRPPSPERFQEIGHALAAWLAAVLGGTLALFFHATRRDS